jgi:HlyD family secretion protein
MSKKSIYLLIGGAVVVIALIILSKTGVIGNKDEGKEVETVVNAITIVETVSATGKIQPEIEVKISSEVSGEIILLPVVGSSEFISEDKSRSIHFKFEPLQVCQVQKQD